MASCFELDLGRLAFQESVTECALGLTWDGARPLAGLGAVDAHGGTSCVGGVVAAIPMVGACGRCPLTWAMPLTARVRTAASNAPRILIGFEERLIANLSAKGHGRPSPEGAAVKVILRNS